MKEERFSVCFPISLMWEDAGMVRRIIGRCVDLSPEGIKVEVRDRVKVGTTVLVASNQFGRMGHASVRHVQRHKMQWMTGLKFGIAFGLADTVRRKTLERVLSPDDPHAVPPESRVRSPRKPAGSTD